MQSPIYSALDSLSSPTIVNDGEGQSAVFRAMLDPESPLPAMPLWQGDQDPFDAAIGEKSASLTPDAPAAPKFNLGNLTLLERDLEVPEDESTLDALQDQIRATAELIELVREDARLTKMRAAQIQNRWECKGHQLLKLLCQYPNRFEKPSTWDDDIDNLISRLQLENRTEEQLKDVLKIEEECLRGGILAAIQKSLKDHAQTKKNMNDSVVALRSECEMVQNKVRKAASLSSRRNACVAVVNNLYQTMRQDEIGRGEIARGIKLLQAHSSAKDSREEIKGKYISTKAEIEREKSRLRELIAANKSLEEEINLKEIELRDAKVADAVKNMKQGDSGKQSQQNAGQAAARRPFGLSPSANWQATDEDKFC